MSEKPKKILSNLQLEKLKIAREKALTVRQTNAKNKSLEKELLFAEKEKHILEVKEKLAKVRNPASAVIGERLGENIANKKKEQKVIIEPDSEPESEPEIIVKKKKKIKKKIVIVEDSDTDEEQQQVIFVKRKKDNPLKAIQQPTPETVPHQVFKQPPPPPQQEDPYQNQYNSLFNPPRRNF